MHQSQARSPALVGCRESASEKDNLTVYLFFKHLCRPLTSLSPDIITVTVLLTWER
jgi:hypothetical protein